MFIIIGTTSIITSIILILYYFQIRDNREKWIKESDNYSMLNIKFYRRYWISILLSIIFFLSTLGLAAILISI